MGNELVGGVHQHDTLAGVSPFLEQLLGLVQVHLQVFRAGRGFQGRAADEHRRAHLVQAGIAHDCAQVILLAEDVIQRLAHLRIVEGRQQVVGPQHHLGPDGVGHLYLDFGIALHQRQQVDGRILVVVHFPGVHGRHARVRVWDVDPLHAVHID